AAERDAEPLGAGARVAHRLDARGLPAAEGERTVGGGEGDGVRLDVLDDAPGEGERQELLGRRPPPRHHARLARVLDRAVLVLDQHPRTTPRMAGARTSFASGCQRTSLRCFLRSSSSSASGSKPGAIRTSVKISSTAHASGSVHGLVETTMPPKGDSGSVA